MRPPGASARCGRWRPCRLRRRGGRAVGRWLTSLTSWAPRICTAPTRVVPSDLFFDLFGVPARSRRSGTAGRPWWARAARRATTPSARWCSRTRSSTLLARSWLRTSLLSRPPRVPLSLPALQALVFLLFPLAVIKRIFLSGLVRVRAAAARPRGRARRRRLRSVCRARPPEVPHLRGGVGDRSADGGRGRARQRRAVRGGGRGARSNLAAHPRVARPGARRQRARRVLTRASRPRATRGDAARRAPRVPAPRRVPGPPCARGAPARGRRARARARHARHARRHALRARGGRPPPPPPLPPLPPVQSGHVSSRPPY